MRTMETKDEFIKGVIAGAIGSLLLFLFVQAFNLLSLIKYDQFRLAGEVVFNYQPNLFNKFIGFFMTIALGAFWGIILAFVFTKLLNGNFYILKGIVFAFSIFILNLGFLDVVFQYPKDLHDSSLNILVFLLGYCIYGITTAIILKRLGIFENG
ncbi:MAG: DUF6789 family protein [Bacillota bacterium]